MKTLSVCGKCYLLFDFPFLGFLSWCVPSFSKRCVLSPFKCQGTPKTGSRKGKNNYRKRSTSCSFLSQQRPWNRDSARPFRLGLFIFKLNLMKTLCVCDSCCSLFVFLFFNFQGQGERAGVFCEVHVFDQFVPDAILQWLMWSRCVVIFIELE